MCSRSGRRWRNCSIPRSTAAMPASAPAPDCSRRRTIPGTAAPAARPPRIARGRRRAGPSDDVAKRDASLASPDHPAHPRPRPTGGRGRMQAGPPRSAAASTKPPQANYGTSATIPTLDPELAKQLGFTTEEEDLAAMARPPRNKMEALGVAATADALENLIRDGRPEFKGEDGQIKIWTPHRPPRPEKSEGGVPLRDQIRIRAEGRPADRDQGTGRGHQRATTAPRCCSASPAPARPTPWPR